MSEQCACEHCRTWMQVEKESRQERDALKAFAKSAEGLLKEAKDELERLREVERAAIAVNEEFKNKGFWQEYTLAEEPFEALDKALLFGKKEGGE